MNVGEVIEDWIGGVEHLVFIRIWGEMVRDEIEWIAASDGESYRRCWGCVVCM